MAAVCNLFLSLPHFRASASFPFYYNLNIIVYILYYILILNHVSKQLVYAELFWFGYLDYWSILSMCWILTTINSLPPQKGSFWTSHEVMKYMTTNLHTDSKSTTSNQSCIKTTTPAGQEKEKGKKMHTKAN